MAWVFSLSAECGTEQSQAERFAEHFRDITWTLDNGIESQCQADVFADLAGNWWCRVCPSGLSQIGIDAPESAYVMTELGILLYQRLRSAPAFRYGIVGVEVDEFRTYSELIDDGTVASLPGIVVDRDIWQLLGSPSTLRNFATGDRLGTAILCFRNWDYGLLGWNGEHLARLVTTDKAISYQVKKLPFPIPQLNHDGWHPQANKLLKEYRESQADWFTEMLF